MAKIHTPAMDRAAKAAKKRQGKASSPFTNAMRRLMKNKLAVIGLVIFVIYIFAALFPGVIAHQDPYLQNFKNAFAPPSSEHLLGTDNLGRDNFSRIIYACRVSLGIGIAATVISLILGGVIGAISAFYGGTADNILMRIIDILQSIPSILLAMSISAAFGKTIPNLLLAMGVSYIPPFAKTVRASILTAKDRQFVEAGKCLGANDPWLIFKHMIPNSLGPIIVQTTFGVAASILAISALSYIGLGVQTPTPEWGGMLSAGKQYLQKAGAWPLTIIPGIAIMLISFALNTLGDGLRDAFDPKMK